MRTLTLLTALLTTLPFGACSGSNPSSGQTAYMRIDNAQFIAGSIDTADHGALPEVHTIATRSNDVFSGVSGKSFSGDVGPGSTGILIGLLGDSGHWAMPVENVDQNTPTDFTFSCTASFSMDPPRTTGEP